MDRGSVRAGSAAAALLIALLSPAAFGEPAADSLEAIRKLVRESRHAAAEAAARSLLARAAADADSLLMAEAMDLIVEALWRGGRAADPDARAFGERAVGIKERRLGPDAAPVAASLLQLATVRRRTGDAAGARAGLERALAIREKALGPDAPEVAQVLNSLGILLQGLPDVPAARACHERALAIREQAFGPDAPEVGQSLNNLAVLLKDGGDDAGARPLFERVLAIHERASGPRSVEIATALVNLGKVDATLAREPEARAHFERALAMREELLGAGHPDVAEAADDLGVLLMGAGDHPRAAALIERALAIREAALGPDHAAVAASLNSLGVLRMETGDYAAARPPLERALEVRTRALAPDHPAVAVSLNNLGRLLCDLGDFPAARPLLERALAIEEKRFGPAAPELAWALGNLALAASARDDPAGAVRHARRALAARESGLGPEHPDVADARADLALYLARAGDLGEARALHERALAALRRALGAEHPRTVRVESNLAGVLAASGDHAGACDLYRRALAAAERALGPGHRRVAYLLHDLANSLRDAGRREEALATALRAEEAHRAHLRLAFRLLPERQALGYARGVTGGYDLMLVLAVEAGPAARAAVFDALIRTRAAVLDEMTARRRALAAAADPALAPLVARYRAAGERLASLAVRDAAGAGGGRDALDSARVAAERAERALAERGAAQRGAEGGGGTGLAGVAAALPGRAALLAYARYERIRPRGSGRRPGLAPAAEGRYLAFVLRPGDAAPAVVPLGAAAEIEDLVAAWKEEAGRLPARAAPAEAERACREKGEALRRRIWDPVAPHFRGAERVFVVPDGALCLVSLASLPSGRSRYLVESPPLVHYLSTERDLAPPPAARREGSGLLALGGPDFDARPALAAVRDDPERGRAPDPAGAGPAAADPDEPELRIGCEEFRRARFQPLPGTEREAREVTALWSGPAAGSLRSAGGEATVVELFGPEASEAAFKRRAPGHAVLHVATHGFFLGGACPSLLAGGRGIGGLSPIERPAAAPPAAGDRPLALSGLVLAGANRRGEAGPDEDDGILTAEEIGALDLSGVRWAVLSACETGVGEVQSGEGVIGMRRSFQLAGAGTVIMSLWAVEDDATRRWMRALYAARLERGLATAEAVREAALAVLEERRARGAATHPFYWGAFVASGDWR